MVIPAALSNISVVIVEDDAEFRSMLVRFLTLEGAWVVARSDVFDGVRAVKEHDPDVVLSEISLANGGGLQLLRDIRALGPENGGSVPVIAMIAFAQISDPESANASGFQEHLRKPFAPDQLLAAIKSALRG
jgi:CheY-like chemotaxis protein